MDHEGKRLLLGNTCQRLDDSTTTQPSALPIPGSNPGTILGGAPSRGPGVGCALVQAPLYRVHVLADVSTFVLAIETLLLKGCDENISNPRSETFLKPMV